MWPPGRDLPEYIFQQWKVAVGLPKEFPRLDLLEEEDLDTRTKLYIGLAHQDKIEEILDRAGAPLVAVLVNKGHGCTTLSRYIFKEISNESVRRRLIPIRLELDDIMEAGEDPLMVLEEKMGHGIVRSLVMDPWERLLDTRQYASLIGAVGSGAVSLEAHRIALAGAVLSDDWEGAGRLSGTLGLRVEDLLAELAQAYSVRISLQIDFSSRAEGERYETMVFDLGRAIKTLHERDGRRPRPTLPAVLNELYFVSPEGFDILNSGWSRQYSEIQYPWYRAADVFAILSSRYPFVTLPGRGRREPLSAVVDSDFLGRSVAQDKSLKMILEDFEDRVKKAFRSWEDVRYQLRAPEPENDDSAGGA